MKWAIMTFKICLLHLIFFDVKDNKGSNVNFKKTVKKTFPTTVGWFFWANDPAAGGSNEFLLRQKTK